MAVSKRLRYEILRRDNHACRYCGAAAPDVKLNVDHVIPQALGGSNAPTNLVASCADCNAGKTSSMPNAMPVEDVDQDTFRQGAAMKQAAEDQRTAVFVHLYGVWAWAWERTGHHVTDLDQLYFAEETYKVIDCGLSARVDLTEAAFRAGSDSAVDIASYISFTAEASSVPISAEDARFMASVNAVNAWDSAWERSSADGPPVGNAVNHIIDQVGEALDAGTHPMVVLRAATLAGQDLSTDLRKHLSDLSTAGGGN